MWNANGELLWRNDGGEYFYFSASGKYLYSHYSALNTRPLRVLDVQTGRTLWQLEYSAYWQASTSTEEKLFYYADNDLTKCYQLQSGKTVWETKVDDARANSHGTLYVAKSGRLVAFQAQNDVARLTNVYDGEGHLIWKTRNRQGSGLSNGGVIKGVSEDGRLIAFGDSHEFYVLRGATRELVWRYRDRVVPQHIQRFTSRYIAFRAQPANFTRVILLNPDGTIKYDYVFRQFVDFQIYGTQNFLVVQKEKKRMRLTLFRLLP